MSAQSGRVLLAEFDRLGHNRDIPPCLFIADDERETEDALHGFAQRYLPGRVFWVDPDLAHGRAQIRTGLGDLLGGCTITEVPADNPPAFKGPGMLAAALRAAHADAGQPLDLTVAAVTAAVLGYLRRLALAEGGGVVSEYELADMARVLSHLRAPLTHDVEELYPLDDDGQPALYPATTSGKVGT